MEHAMVLRSRSVNVRHDGQTLSHSRRIGLVRAL